MSTLNLHNNIRFDVCDEEKSQENHFCESVLTHYDTFSEAAKMSWALRGGCGRCDDLHRDSPCFATANPRCGQRESPKNLSALCVKTALQSFRSLPRKHSFQRPGEGEKDTFVFLTLPILIPFTSNVVPARFCPDVLPFLARSH